MDIVTWENAKPGDVIGRPRGDDLRKHRGTHVQLVGGPQWPGLLFESASQAESNALCDFALKLLEARSAK